MPNGHMNDACLSIIRLGVAQRGDCYRGPLLRSTIISPHSVCVVQHSQAMDLPDNTTIGEVVTLGIDLYVLPTDSITFLLRFRAQVGCESEVLLLLIA